MRGKKSCHFAINPHDSGFTLIEVLVSMAIMSILFGGIYSAYDAQMRSYNTQNQILDMNQNIRAAMALMQKEIRLAGASVPANPDPGTTTNGNLANLGLISGYPASGNTISSSQIALAYFQTSFDASRNESLTSVQCAYRIQGNEIQRYFSNTGTWEIVANNIDAMDFRYFDANGDVIDSGGGVVAPGNLGDVRSIQISIVAHTSEQVSGLSYRGRNDAQLYTNMNGDTILDMSTQPLSRQRLRRTQLSSSVYLRNLAYQ